LRLVWREYNNYLSLNLKKEVISLFLGIRMEIKLEQEIIRLLLNDLKVAPRLEFDEVLSVVVLASIQTANQIVVERQTDKGVAIKAYITGDCAIYNLIDGKPRLALVGPEQDVIFKNWSEAKPQLTRMRKTLDEDPLKFPFYSLSDQDMETYAQIPVESMIPIDEIRLIQSNSKIVRNGYFLIEPTKVDNPLDKGGLNAAEKMMAQIVYGKDSEDVKSDFKVSMNEFSSTGTRYVTMELLTIDYVKRLITTIGRPIALPCCIGGLVRESRDNEKEDYGVIHGFSAYCDYYITNKYNKYTNFIRAVTRDDLTKAKQLVLRLEQMV